jgi:hypothetical protein
MNFDKPGNEIITDKEWLNSTILKPMMSKIASQKIILTNRNTKVDLKSVAYPNIDLINFTH